MTTSRKILQPLVNCLKLALAVSFINAIFPGLIGSFSKTGRVSGVVL